MASKKSVAWKHVRRYSRLNNGHTKIGSPNSWILQTSPFFFWKRGFADVIMFSILRRDYPRLSQWAWNAIINVIKRQRQTEINTDWRQIYRKHKVKVEAETGVTWPQVEECHQTLKAKRGKEWMVFEASKRSWIENLKQVSPVGLKTSSL